jgi:hypothetical protein
VAVADRQKQSEGKQASNNTAIRGSAPPSSKSAKENTAALRSNARMETQRMSEDRGPRTARGPVPVHAHTAHFRRGHLAAAVRVRRGTQQALHARCLLVLVEVGEVLF